MNKSLQGRFPEVVHNNYTLYYFVYMYTQICDENAFIWGFPRRMIRVVVYRARIALLTPMLNHFSLLNSVSRDAALTPISIDNEEFHFICIPIYNFHTYLQYRSKYPRSWSIENKSTCNNLYQTTTPRVIA